MYLGDQGSRDQLLGAIYSCMSTLNSGRALYRPPGIPVLVGSDTFGRVQSGIPTQRPGPRGSSRVPTRVKGAILYWRPSSHFPDSYVKGIESTRNMEAHQGDGVLYSQGESYVGRVQWTSWRPTSEVATVKGAGAVTKLGALSSP